MGEILLLLWIHFVADFITQDDEMATKKSSHSGWLTLHCAIYALCFIWLGWQFAAVTFALHFAVDFVTSRATAALFKAERRHWFFVVIGFDQALHMTQLVWLSEVM